jgi:hypothetical protein
MRLWFPARSQQVLDLRLWQWPQCVGLFCLGVTASSWHWAEQVPARVRRRCGLVIVAALVVAPGCGGHVRGPQLRSGRGWCFSGLALAVVGAGGG